MPASTRLYAWEGVTATGVPQHGQQAGRSPAFVQAWLRQQGIRVTSVRPAGRPRWRWPQREGKVDAAGFSRQLATLLTAGVPLLQAFEVMARSNADAPMRTLVERLSRDVAQGLALAQALRRYAHVFDTLYCDLVRVGEQSGTLDRQLEQLASMLETRQALRRKVRKAMLYPALLLLTGLGVAALLLLEVVPRFEGMFASAEQALPAFTQWVIDMSTGLGLHAWWLALLGVAAGVTGREVYRRYLPGRLWMLRQILRLPVLGRLLGQAAMARFARSLGTAYGAGVALLDALETVAPVSGDALHEQAIIGLRQRVAHGLGLERAMAADGLFPPLLRQLVAVGESSGTLDQMLCKAAQHYEEQVGEALGQLTTLLEPAIVLILGLLVGGLVVAMYLPIFQLGSLM
ncbi:type II secretion system F family protein [Pseudomonas sp. NY15463]|uniref:type II secretion system F family protein n=1 Tax=Pseudomonas sp. NY15463 TaxID=3400361 RepID=UPI003A861DA9